MIHQQQIVSYTVFILIILIIGIFATKSDNAFKANSLLELFASPKQIINFDNTDIYMINLDRNADRLESFIEQYMMCDLRYKQFQRIPAVDGSSLDIKQYISNFAYKEIMQIEKTGYRTKHYQLTRGAIGCYLSHIKVYELIAAGESDYGIVFEDDVMIDKNVLSKLNKVLPTMDDDWDMLLLGCHCIVCDKFESYYKLEKFFLLHGFVMKKSAAIKILEILRNKKITQQIDSELSDMITQGHVNVYCLKSQLAKQQDFDTNIQTPLKVMPGVNPYTVLV